MNSATYSRFDIVAAHYCYCAQWHSGQWSREYRRLSRMSRYTRNMPTTLADLTHHGENAVAIYLDLIEKHQPAALASETAILEAINA